MRWISIVYYIRSCEDQIGHQTMDFFRSAVKDAGLRELLREEIQIAETSQADTSLFVREYEEKIRETNSLLSLQRRKVCHLSIKPSAGIVPRPGNSTTLYF